MDGTLKVRMRKGGEDGIVVRARGACEHPTAANAGGLLGGGEADKGVVDTAGVAGEGIIPPNSEGVGAGVIVAAVFRERGEVILCDPCAVHQICGRGGQTRVVRIIGKEPGVEVPRHY